MNTPIFHRSVDNIYLDQVLIKEGICFLVSKVLGISMKEAHNQCSETEHANIRTALFKANSKSRPDKDDEDAEAMATLLA